MLEIKAKVVYSLTLPKEASLYNFRHISSFLQLPLNLSVPFQR